MCLDRKPDEHTKRTDYIIVAYVGPSFLGPSRVYGIGIPLFNILAFEFGYLVEPLPLFWFDTPSKTAALSPGCHHCFSTIQSLLFILSLRLSSNEYYNIIDMFVFLCIIQMIKSSIHTCICICS